MDFKKGKNGSDIGSNKLENYHFKIDRKSTRLNSSH